MKLKELKKDVCALCFITPEEGGVGFINAVRRALSIIFCEMNITGKRTVAAVKKSICKSDINIHHTGGKNLTLPLSGRAYAVKISGKGSFTVRDGAVLKTEEFDCTEKIFKGFINYGGEIEFQGDYAYTILSFVTFSDIFSDKVSDIPDDGTCFIDMSIFPDFFSFCGVAEDAAGNEIRGIKTDGAKIFVPDNYSGRISIRYRKRPLPLFDDSEQSICLPDAYLPLLAPLCASLLLADDDRELSDCYMQLYRRMADGMKETEKEAKYVKTNGWA